MDKASEYRSYAEAALELAARANDNAHKAIALKIAQGWLDLSRQAENGPDKVIRTPDATLIPSPPSSSDD
jgi:hypothetical protein